MSVSIERLTIVLCIIPYRCRRQGYSKLRSMSINLLLKYGCNKDGFNGARRVLALQAVERYTFFSYQAGT